jgi:flagellar basal-body rod modification protein FlgD
VPTAEQSIEVSAAALEFALGAARPNPSGSLTSLELSLPQASSGRVVVVDPSGRVVRTVQEGMFEAGILDFSWDGRDDAGRRIGAGVFFVRAEIDLLGSRSTKLIRLR